MNLGDKILQCRMSTGLQPANLDLTDTRSKESCKEEDVDQLTILQAWTRASNSDHRPPLKDTLRFCPPPMLGSSVFLHLFPPLDYHWSGSCFWASLAMVEHSILLYIGCIFLAFDSEGAICGILL